MRVELTNGRTVEMTDDELRAILASEGVTMLGLQALAWGDERQADPDRVIKSVEP